MTYADYTDNPALLKNAPAKEEFALQSIEQTIGGSGFYVNVNKTE